MWSVRVDNLPLAEVEGAFALCEGGLRLRLVLLDTVVDSGLVPARQSFEESVPRAGADVGDAAMAEGWCLASDGSEVGYVKIAGKIRQPNNPAAAYTTLAGPPLTETARSMCVTGVVERGTPPCLMNMLF